MISLATSHLGNTSFNSRRNGLADSVVGVLENKVPFKVDELYIGASPTNSGNDEEEAHVSAYPKSEQSINLSSLSALYSESAFAKIWGVALRALGNKQPPTQYPEYTNPNGDYVYSDAEFWTSGFFPGSLYLLLERQMKYPSSFPSSCQNLSLPLKSSCEWWTTNLHKNALIEDTHDLGFMIAPWARKAWELNRDQRAHDTLITAAKTLATRFNLVTGCLRSWDTCKTKRYEFTDPNSDFLVIIDNMLNLDLLFWAAQELNDPRLHDMATSHAKMTRKNHIRPDSSTYHVVNYDQQTGAPKSKFTNQGYSDESCWSRGQAWAILGFVQTYLWTKDPSFLATARKCADYFLAHLAFSGVPYWDFNAPVAQDTPTDTSAAMAAVYGLLLLHEAAVDRGESSVYFESGVKLLEAVRSAHVTPRAQFVNSTSPATSQTAVVKDIRPLAVDMGGVDTILGGATINNYEFAPRKWANHGLVYADYYFLLVGNKLLEIGVGSFR